MNTQDAAAVETSQQDAAAQDAQAAQGLNLSIEEAGFYIESLTNELAAANEAGRVATVKLHVANIRVHKLAGELEAAQAELEALKNPVVNTAAATATDTTAAAPAAADAAAMPCTAAAVPAVDTTAAAPDMPGTANPAAA